MKTETYQTETTNEFLDQIIEAAGDYEDGETGTDRCIEYYCKDKGHSDEACERAQRRAFVQGALEAGIPLAVIEGRSRLPMDLSDIADVEVEGADEGPKFVDAFISSAYWKSKDRPLNDSELDRLNDEHSDFVHEKVIEWVY